MISYRHFLNTDLRYLSEIWEQQPPLRGQLAKLSLFQIEHLILAKPYFDPRGLILAVEEAPQPEATVSSVVPRQPEKVHGFVHASFAPNVELSDVDRSMGVISMLQLGQNAGSLSNEIADRLISEALSYLRGCSASIVHAGSRFPSAPFYLGMYGGSDVPGVMAQDQEFLDALLRNGFQERDRVAVLRRPLAGFRPIGGRDQLMVRRKFQINTVMDPKEQSWWECCTLGMANRERFSIYHKQNQRVCGSVSFWDMEPLAASQGQMARGMYGLNVPEEFRRGGIATFLVSEALKYYMQQGVEFVEAQTLASDPAAIGVFGKLGFEQIDEGVLLSRSL